MTRVSAVSKVEKTSHDLVKQPKSRGKLATMQDYAKVDFDPWPEPKRDKETGLVIPADPMMLHCGFLVRTAHVACSRTKDQLGDMFEKDPAMTDKLMADWAEAQEQLKAMIITMDTAYLRMLSAAAARQISNDKAKRRRA